MITRSAAGVAESRTDGAGLAANLISRVNVGDMLTRTALRSPRATAIVDDAVRLSYHDFNGWVNQVANGLRARGYQRGDVLAIVSANRAEFLVAYYACAKVGVVVVPINLGWSAEEVGYVLEHAKVRGIVAEVQHRALIAAVTERRGDVDLWLMSDGSAAAATFDDLRSDDASEPECYVEDRDTLQYLYTSGTTSRPKGVQTSHLSVYVESLGGALDKELRRGDVMACVMPLFHCAQLNTFCTALVATGSTMLLMRGFDADRWLASVEDEKVTVGFLLPMMIRTLLDRDDVETRELSSLRLIVYAMSPMPQHELERAMTVFGCGFGLSFGQTEMSPESTYHRPEHQLSHPGSVGTAGSNVTVGVMAEDGSLLAPGQTGEIVYRSPQVLTGYLRNPDATAEAFRHGWFHSGDIGRLSEDRVLYFVDRLKDVIKTGGENVASIEVEKACFAADPNVGDVAVIGLPHERWTEAITAIVVAKPGTSVDADALRRALRDSLAAYKSPKAVITVEELPRTSTGKIQKVLLRQRFRDFYTGTSKET